MSIFSSGGIGIDLGSSNTTIFLSDRGIALREPTSALVLRNVSQDVVAVGKEAHAMLGRTPLDVMLVHPILDGAVTDVDLAALLMLALTEKVAERKKPMDKAQLVVSMSHGATKVEQAALLQAMRSTGARRPVALRTPVAAALGAGLSIEPARGTMMVDVGGGTTEIAVLSMQSIVAARVMRTGSYAMDDAIVRYMRREKGIVIGLSTAEEMKKDIGAASETRAEEVEDKVQLRGRDVESGKPKTIEIESKDVFLALREPLLAIVDAIRDAILNVPPELATDILDTGIHLTGGGALLAGLDELLEKETGLSVTMTENPQDDVALGVGRVASDEKLCAELLACGSACD